MGPPPTGYAGPLKGASPQARPSRFLGLRLNIEPQRTFGELV